MLLIVYVISFIGALIMVFNKQKIGGREFLPPDFLLFSI